MNIKKLDIAIVHRQYGEMGGAEKLTNTLAHMFDAPIYTSFVNENISPDNIDVIGLFNESPLLPIIKNVTTFRNFYYMWKWMYRPELKDYDIIIQSGGNDTGWYVPHDDQILIRYVHSTPRTPYDQFQDRGKSSIIKIYGTVARVLDQHTIKYPDSFVANSDLVAYRMEKYWDETPDKIAYPPVDVEKWNVQVDTKDYFLTYSRLVESKRIEQIVETFTERDEKLIICGSGPKENRLQQISSNYNNIEIRGFVPQQELYKLVSGAQAVIYNAKNEDFGYVPVESMAAGTPVIGVRDGFTKFQIQDRNEEGFSDGRVGIVFDDICEGIERFRQEGVSANESEIKQEAMKYNMDQFREKMGQIVKETISETPVEVKI